MDEVPDRDTYATRLLDAARVAAHDALAPLPNTEAGLRSLAHEVRAQVVRQASRGLWAPVGAATAAALAGLVVRARRGQVLLNEPPVVLELDFAATTIPHLRVGTERARGQS